MNDRQKQSPGKIHLTVDGALAWLTIDNPERLNALDTKMWERLPSLVREALAVDTVRVLIVRGAGDRAFSTGADISEFDDKRSGDTAKAYDDLNHAAFEALRNVPLPVIAMIGGFCLGGGLALALNCDLRIAAEDSQFALPPAKLGIGYDPRWIKTLLSVVPPPVAKQILFTGRRFDHGEALAMGLVNAVVAPDRLEPAVTELANEIAANAPLSIRAAKRAIDELTRRPETPDMAALDRLTDSCMTSEDYSEGRAAFLEKRKPVFRGK